MSHIIPWNRTQGRLQLLFIPRVRKKKEGTFQSTASECSTFTCGIVKAELTFLFDKAAAARVTPAAVGERRLYTKSALDSGSCVSRRRLTSSCGPSLPLIAAHGLYVEYRSLTCAPPHFTVGPFVKCVRALGHRCMWEIKYGFYMKMRTNRPWFGPAKRDLMSGSRGCGRFKGKAPPFTSLFHLFTHFSHIFHAREMMLNHTFPAEVPWWRLKAPHRRPYQRLPYKKKYSILKKKKKKFPWHSFEI